MTYWILIMWFVPKNVVMGTGRGIAMWPVAIFDTQKECLTMLDQMRDIRAGYPNKANLICVPSEIDQSREGK